MKLSFFHDTAGVSNFHVSNHDVSTPADGPIGAKLTRWKYDLIKHKGNSPDLKAK